MRNDFPADTVFTDCRLCPRGCGVNRRLTKGFCGAGARAQVYTYGPHHGEEPPVSGDKGSGAVFFSRCTMHCLYCQNYPWSSQGRGAIVGAAGLASILERLYHQGCHNWNLVTPTPWLPDIVSALQELSRRGIRLPVVYNTSGYETTATLAALDEWVDVYLTDLRYADQGTAAEASQAPDYVDVARAALHEMWRRKGTLQTGADGTAVRGVICRILVLPGRAGEALASLRWLVRNFGTDLPVSVMAQYTPAWEALRRPGWDRLLTDEEYAPVADAAAGLGFTTGWIQELASGSSPSLVGYNMKPAAGPAVMQNQG